MPQDLIAKIGVENCAYSFDSLFSFRVPETLRDRLQPGMRVLVPFGKGDRLRQGFVFSVGTDDPETGRELKPVCRVLDEEALLGDEMLQLALQLREQTFCTYFTAAKALLPGGMCLYTQRLYRLKEAYADDADALRLNVQEKEMLAYLSRQKAPVPEREIMKAMGLSSADALRRLEHKGLIEGENDAFSKVGQLSVRMIRLSDSYSAGECDLPLTPKQQNVVSLLSDVQFACTKEICYFAGVTSGVVRTLLTKGVLTAFDLPVSRSPIRGSESGPFVPPVLNDAQQTAYLQLLDSYLSDDKLPSLLFGVTGSGKTNVYLALIDRVVADGKGVIVLVPEISLTSQTISLFTERYGEKIAVLHSGLSMGERRDEFYRIKHGEASIVIGTRSAVFAPLSSIGAIIVDEEQEHTYKSEMAPRYDARFVARFRGAYHNALVVFASATPSVETYAKAKAGKYRLSALTQRYGDAHLPQVTTVDVSDKRNTDRYSAISLPLLSELEAALKRGEQSILLVNRRGFNTFVACQECKHVITCPKCSISLTYHAANHRLMCHYCGYSEEYTDTCPTCGNRNIRYAGFGTQRVEQELHRRLPDARILRMDADTTAAKNAHEKALSAFANGKYDILVGTQMVAKGLDFPNVTLVGVLSADSELYSDDFRSAERTFDLLTQVVGRAGRSKTGGKAMIQTASPDNSILAIAARQDYPRFFETEIALRKALTYPPFCDLCLVGVSNESEERTLLCAKFFFDTLIRLNAHQYHEKLIVLGPLQPKIAKMNNAYRQKMIIKCKNSANFRALIDSVLKTVLNNKEFRNINLFAVINPENMD